MLDAWTELDAKWESGYAEAQRIDDVRPASDVRVHLHPRQLEVFECGAPAMNILGGRQGGKTFVDVGWLIEGALENDRSINPYFGLTAKSIDDIMWPEVVLWWQLLGFNPDDLHQHGHVAKLPNGSIVRGEGTDDRRHIESKRGAKFNRIVIDEMGSQSNEFIGYFIDLLRPTLIKNRGRMIRSGNPGLILQGYWFDQTNEQRKVPTPLFHWTAWDNPHLGTNAEVDAFVSEQIHDSCGLTLADIRRQIEDGAQDGPPVTFQREWLAKWIADAGALVYPYSIERNQVAELPTRTESGVHLPPAGWRRVLAADCGWVDATAFVAWAMHPLLPDDYCIYAERHHGMLSPEFRERTRELVRELEITTTPRVDMGGYGKSYGEDCIRHGVPVRMAEKKDKPALIRLVRDRLLGGRSKYLDGKVTPLLEEMGRLGWDNKRLSHKEGVPDDCCDAANYGWRDLHNYRDAQTPPPKSAAEIAREQEDAWLSARLRNPKPRTDAVRAAFTRR